MAPAAGIVGLPVALLVSAAMLGFRVTRREPKPAWAIGTMAALAGWVVGLSLFLLLFML